MLALPTDPDRLLDVQELCEYLGLRPTRVREMLRKRELPGVKLGRRWLVRRKDLLAIFDRAATEFAQGPIETRADEGGRRRWSATQLRAVADANRNR